MLNLYDDLLWLIWILFVYVTWQSNWAAVHRWLEVRTQSTRLSPYRITLHFIHRETVDCSAARLRANYTTLVETLTLSPIRDCRDNLVDSHKLCTNNVYNNLTGTPPVIFSITLSWTVSLRLRVRQLNRSDLLHVVKGDSWDRRTGLWFTTMTFTHQYRPSLDDRNAVNLLHHFLASLPFFRERATHWEESNHSGRIVFSSVRSLWLPFRVFINTNSFKPPSLATLEFYFIQFISAPNTCKPATN